MSNVSRKELHRILNQTVAACFSEEGDAINVQANIFKNKYEHFVDSNQQLGLFEDEIPTEKEVRDITHFCYYLDKFRESMDVYTKEYEAPDECFYERLMSEIEKHRAYIVPENIKTLTKLENIVKNNLPGMREQKMLDEYLNKAELVINLRKKHKQNTKKHPKGYEDIADDLITNILKDTKLHMMASSQNRLDLYTRCVDVVDCLSPQRYNRTKKYKLKCKFYLAVNKEARILKKEEIAQKAYGEYMRYVDAINNAAYYGNKRRMEASRR